MSGSDELWRDENACRELEQSVCRDTAVVVLRDGHGRVLFARTMRLPNHWSLPGGGVEPADGSPAVAAVRELREELGLRLSAPTLRPLASAPSDLDRGTVHFFEAPEPLTDAVLRTSAEILETEWLNPGDALLRQLMPATRRLLINLAGGTEAG